MNGPRTLSFSSRKAATVQNLDAAFRLVRAFVARTWSPARFVRLAVGCQAIEDFRKSHPGKVGQRSVMHVGHKQGAVCALALCDRLPAGHLAGLFLHEFGHLGSGGEELEADRWVLDTFGISIRYESELDLEWINPFAVSRILASAKIVPPDFKHNP
jgi:hypothetical protein